MSSTPNAARSLPWAWVVLAIGFGGVCVALGFWLGHSISSPSIVPAALAPEPGPRNESAQELAKELRRLREEVERLGAVRSERAPAAPAGDDLARLQRSIDALALAVTRSRADAITTTSNPMPMPDRNLFARLANEYKALPKRGDEFDQDAEDAWSRWWESQARSLSETHSLWTIDEVVARYGRPKLVDSESSGISIHYQVAETEANDLEVVFSFNSGRVVYTEIREEARQR